MSSNAYRKTESFFRRVEDVLASAVDMHPDKWAAKPTQWALSTTVVNLTFALASFLENRDWPSVIDRVSASERFRIYYFAPQRKNDIDLVVWKRRTHSHTEMKALRGGDGKPESVSTNYDHVRAAQDKTAMLRLDFSDTDRFQRICLVKLDGLLSDGVIFFGEPQDIHAQIARSTGNELIELPNTQQKMYLLA